MIITAIVITIESSEGEDFQPRQIIMNGHDWQCPPHMFPRDVRLVSQLELMVKNYNGFRRKNE